MSDARGNPRAEVEYDATIAECLEWTSVTAPKARRVAARWWPGLTGFPEIAVPGTTQIVANASVRINGERRASTIEDLRHNNNMKLHQPKRTRDDVLHGSEHRG
jgi:hypothetical protein